MFEILLSLVSLLTKFLYKCQNSDTKILSRLLRMIQPTYRLLSRDLLKLWQLLTGITILKVDPSRLELLAKEAVSDLSFYLRTSHLEKLARILQDPEATDNDRFVAYIMLRNTVISSKGELPWCQDTGTAIVIGKKGEQVLDRGERCRISLSRGILRPIRIKI